MSEDIVAELRAWDGSPFDDDAHAAADEIVHLRGEVERLTRERDEAKEQLRGTEAASALQGYGVDTHAMLQAGLKTARELAIKFRDERNAAEAKVAKLREALKPFAEKANVISQTKPDDGLVLLANPDIQKQCWQWPNCKCDNSKMVTYGDFRRARAILQETEQ